jgi:hypothetical protein
MKGNSLGSARTFATAFMLTCTHSRTPLEFIESFTKTIVARWLPGFLLRYIIPSQTASVHAVVDCRRDPTWIRENLR